MACSGSTFSHHVAKTRETWSQWSPSKLEQMLGDFRTLAPEPKCPLNPGVEYVPSEEMKENILNTVTGFNIIISILSSDYMIANRSKEKHRNRQFLKNVEKDVMRVS